MPGEIVMPRMGLTMETGTVVHWLKHEGEQIMAGVPLLEIETDKASVEIEALEPGTLHKIVAAEGDEVPVGAVIAYFLKPGEEAGPSSASVVAANAGSTPAPAVALQSPHWETAVPVPSSKVRASPAARHLARNLGVDLAAVQGSGPNGRVVAWNVAAMTTTRPETEATAPPRVSPVAQRVAAEKGLDLAGLRGSGLGGTITRKDVEQASQSAAAPLAAQALPEIAGIAPLTHVQRVMAERMAHSFGTAPHFYLHVEVDARPLTALREQLLPRFEESDQVHITFTDLLIYFCGRTLLRHPLVMSQWSKEGLRQFNHVNIGIAVEAANGLLVPVIRDVDELGLVEVARKRADLSERGRRGKLLPEEFEQGTFTISNLGMYPIDSFDAILNPPQAALLAVGCIKERAWVENGQVIPAAVMNLSLSVDHRVLDGARAARFLGELADMIETPGLCMR